MSMREVFAFHDMKGAPEYAAHLARRIRAEGRMLTTVKLLEAAEWQGDVTGWLLVAEEHRAALADYRNAGDAFHAWMVEYLTKASTA